MSGDGVYPDAGWLGELFDTIRVSLFVFDPVRDHGGAITDLRYVFLNAAAESMYQRPAADVVGSCLRELFPSVDERGVFATYVEPFDTGAPSTMYVPWFSDGGVEGVFLVSACLFGDGVLVVALDATQQVQSEFRYRLVAENATDAVWQMSADGTIVWVSPSIEALLGWRPDELVGTSGRGLLHADDRGIAAPAGTGAADASAFALPARVRIRLRTAEGGYRWVSASSRLVAAVEGSGDSFWVGGMQDVQAEVEAERDRVRAIEQFQTLMNTSPLGMALANAQRRFVAVNSAFCELLGREASWLLAHSLPDVVFEDDLSSVIAEGSRVLEGSRPSSSADFRVIRGDGQVRWVHRTSTLLPGDEGEKLLLVQVEDVTEQRAAREQLAFQAFHDALTGLYNRTWIMDMLDNELRLARQDGDSVAVLFVDLDNFKVVNDSLGHEVGDDVLCTIARRISTSLRGRDYAARLGGDEFLIVASDITSPTDVEALAARVTSAINDTLDVQGHRLVVGASVGVSLSYPGSTSASMLRDADSAMFRAKANGRGRWQFFDDTMHTAALERLTTEADLRAGLAEHQFVVHYQPIVTLDPVAIAGHEALVRWQHPTRGLLPPREVLPVAEETGLIIDLGDQVLDQACALLAARPDLPGTISVNQSPVQISAPDWRARFLDTLLRHRTDPHRIIIEVTETAVLSRTAAVAEDLAHLRDLGVGVHIDDFGTGYSSIALLRDLPVTGIKLDKSFTDHVTHETSARVLAAGLASLADGLDLVSIAEGIEHADQAATLTALGWTHGQGYHYGHPRPEPAAAIT